MRWRWRWMLWLLWPAAAPALINPNFTPIHLVGQSHTILELVFAAPAADGKAVAEVRAVLKGKGEAPRTVRIDPTAAIAEGQRDAFNAAAEKGRRALLFIGDFKPASAEGGEMEMGAGGGDKAPKAIAFLHINGLPEEGQWILLEQWEDDFWDMVQGMNFLLATFNGGTDQLARMVRYILADPEADVPVEAGAHWAEPAAQAGRIEGRVAAAVPVWLRESAADLFVAAASGDRLYRWRDGAPADITGESKLASKSALFAWGDFDGDGRLDLASFDGEGLALWRQSAEGVFASTPLARPEGRVLSLDTVAAGGRGAALLVGTDAAPLLGRFADGAMAFRAVAAAPADAAGLGLGSKTLAADFDGDHLPDLLQLGAEGSLFYRGTAPGEFAAPQRVAVRVGGGPHGVALGDFDEDGLLDVFVAAERRHFFWHNEGGGRFEEKLMESGEVSYKFTTDGAVAIASDFNNDGRLDLVIGYNAAVPPYILYNRGFRSFAHALGFDLDKEGRFPAIAEGQQALCFGDFDGDGADDAAAVLRDGGVWLLRRAVPEGGAALAVRAGLPAGEAGPILVVATRFDRPLGARLAAPGRPAIFGARHPGPVKLVWQYPGGARRETEIVLEDRPVNVRLDR